MLEIEKLMNSIEEDENELAERIGTTILEEVDDILFGLEDKGQEKISKEQLKEKLLNRASNDEESFLTEIAWDLTDHLMNLMIKNLNGFKKSIFD